MTVVHVSTQDELDDALENEHVVVKFTAPSWCGPCQRLAPHYEKVAEVLDGVTFVSVDIDEADKELVESYEIMSVPTMIGYFGSNPKSVVIKSQTAPALMREIQGRIDDADAYNR